MTPRGQGGINQLGGAFANGKPLPFHVRLRILSSPCTVTAPVTSQAPAGVSWLRIQDTDSLCGDWLYIAWCNWRQ
ncbi:hypothetical protein CEXT_804461 [Caerostris extrusa]|uniref:Paired domain-containing protein n=1 Tax=Caerostris extrusa TaxID=172846 RepID=A0AAV4NZY4_CAEEX|nr:hypothetical protein CEXT_804461 [Caerostris extrusa]